ncbi:MAG: hypothetical protein CVV44_10600 [Spirochaetae bacterium HGW-Spirochaetae-1]|jgi:D-alanyl-D-alanine carboxypeptidase|nr:MAG: hypothetical protein CVV44_10600 [Spirochaetae bacterium HGW-Spirochaetae-1]
MKTETFKKFLAMLPLLAALLPACCGDIKISTAEYSNTGGTRYAVNAQDLEEVLDKVRDDIGQNSYEAIKSASVAILLPDGSMVSTVSNPENDPYPVASDMKFSIGSTTKTFVAACIYSLADQGKLALTDTLQKLLYDTGVLDETHRENIDPNIRVLDLLTHTSGIDDFLGDLYYYTLGQELYDLEEGGTFEPWTPLKTLSFVSSPDFDFDFLDFLNNEFNYSNTNYILLGLIIEEVTGGKVYPLIKKTLLDPQDLASTFMVGVEPYWGLTSLPGTSALGFEKSIDLDTWQLIWVKSSTLLDVDAVGLYSSTWTSGNMVSTAAEMAAWAKYYYEFQKDHGNTDESALNSMLMTSSYFKDRKYGTGIVFLRHESSAELWGHTGTIVGFSTLVFYMPSKQVGIAILLNSHRAARWDVLNGVVNYINENM